MFLSSCETVSDITDKIISTDEDENISAVDDDNQLISDDLGADPTLAEILAEAENEMEEVYNDDSQLEIADEKLPPTPTTDYDTSLIDSDDSSDSSAQQVEEESTELSLEQEAIVEDNTSSDLSDSEIVPDNSIDDSIFKRSMLDLDDQIQFRIATINFTSGSSAVDYKGLKKIKKIAKIAKERNAKIKIIGHASERTKDMPIAKHKLVNFIISDKRANSVAEIFIKKYNFPSERLITQGVSDSKPLFKEIMPAGTSANQRTEIFLIYN